MVFNRYWPLALVALAACSTDESPRVQIALGQTFLAQVSGLGVQVNVDLRVKCASGEATSTVREVTFGDATTQTITIDGLPACGDAELELSVYVEDPEGRIVAFTGSARAKLVAFVTIPVTFNGPALGELVLTPSDDGVCTVTAERDGAVTEYAVVGGESQRLSVPVDAYSIVCTSDVAPAVERTSTVGVGQRARVEVTFVPIDAALQLAEIALDGVPIADFRPQRDRYSAVYGNAVERVVVSARANNPQAQVQFVDSFLGESYQGTGSVTGTASLPYGDYPLALIVSANAQQAIYVVVLTRDGPRLTSFLPGQQMEPQYFDPSVTAYTLYYPASTFPPVFQINCDPTCAGLTATYNGAPLVPDTVFTIDPPLGATSLVITSTTADHVKTDYTFRVVRGALSNLVCDIPFTPAFDPRVASYTLTNTQPSGVITCTPTAIAPATAEPVTIDLATTTEVAVTARSAGGVQLQDVYTVVRGDGTSNTTLKIFNYDPDTRFLELASLRPGNTSGRDPSTIYPISIDGLAVLDGGQLGSTGKLYLLRQSLDSGISVATTPGDGTLALRPLVTNPESDFDYYFPFDTEATIAGFAFHRTAQVLYTWQNSQVWAVELNAPFVDGPDLGQPGLPRSRTPFAAETFDNGGGVKVLAKPDGRWVYFFGLGTAGGNNFFALETDTVTGMPASSIQSFSIGTPGQAVGDGALDFSGRFIFYTGPLGLNAMTYDPSTGGPPMGVQTAGTNVGQAPITAHPTAPYVYTRQGNRIHLWGYDQSTGVTSEIGLAREMGEAVLAFDIAPDGSTYLALIRQGSTCTLATGAINAGGLLGAPVGSTASCNNRSIHFFTEPPVTGSTLTTARHGQAVRTR